LSNVLVLTGSGEPAAAILPSLSLLQHAVRVAPAEAALRASAPAAPRGIAPAAPRGSALSADVVLVDARTDLVRVRQVFRQLRRSGLDGPVLAVVTEGGWAAVTADWGADDLLLNTAGPGEVEARLRLAISRSRGSEPDQADEVCSGELAISEATYSARLRGRALDLTFKEFELLKFLAQHPRRVFTRSQLLQEVWGYDYFGGTRTVDVHVRRLRAKLGAEHEALIGTVRNVGYRFVPSRASTARASTARASTSRASTAGSSTARASEVRDSLDGTGPAGGAAAVPGPGRGGTRPAGPVAGQARDRANGHAAVTPPPAAHPRRKEGRHAHAEP
jgi:DNA-binding response OmpR family regulator